MKLKKSLSLVLILIVLLLIAGCSKPASKATAPVAPAEVKTMNIGYTGPLSGGGALFGKEVTEGLDMAVDEINAKGMMVNGEKYKINLVKLDDQYMPDKAAVNARRLKQEFKTPAIFVPHSGGAFALQQFNQTEGFLILAFTSEEKISKTGNKLSMQLTTPYNIYPEIYSKKVMDKYGKKIALIPSNSQYGKDWSAAMKLAWEKLGGTIVADIPVDYNKEADFNTHVSKALAAKPDAMFVGGPSQATAIVIKQARQLGFKGGFVIMDQAKMEQMGGIIPLTDLEGAVGISPVYMYDTPGAKPFIERFKAKYNGKSPAWEAVKNYDHMILLAKGIEKAGNVTDAVKIFEGMKALLPLDDTSVVAPIPGISAGGGSLGPGVGIMVENGKYLKPFIVKNPADTTGRYDREIN